METPTPGTTTGRARNRRGEGDRLREEILEAAQELVENGQESAITLRSVARQVGVSAPSIYRHFADRDAIMHAIALIAIDELERALERSGTATDPVQRVREICSAYLAFAREHPHRYRMIFGGVWNARLALESGADLQEAELRTLGQGAYQLLVDAIAGCVQVGRSRAPDPAVAAAAIWVALHGLAQLRETASLFPWPDGLEEEIVTRLARLD